MTILKSLKELANSYLKESVKDKSKKYYQIAIKNIICALQNKVKEKLK